MLSPNTSAQMISIPAARWLPNWSRLICSGVFFSPVLFIRAAILPISVFIPVPVTRTVPRPAATREPENTMLCCSARGTFSALIFPVFFSTLIDSPVRELSFTSRECVSSRRPSAATMSPASRSRISPGTTSEDRISCLRPSRRTPAIGAERDFKLSKDFSAFWCSTVPRTAFKRSTAKMTAVLSTSPDIMEMTAAMIKMMTRRSLN